MLYTQHLRGGVCKYEINHDGVEWEAGVGRGVRLIGISRLGYHCFCSAHFLNDGFERGFRNHSIGRDFNDKLENYKCKI